ncbi:DUF4169 family protein [Roseibium salinum]|nr:DUF4169 family protein [Roseibium salinum]
MSAEIINLRTVRKQKQRQDKQKVGRRQPAQIRPDQG